MQVNFIGQFCFRKQMLLVGGMLKDLLNCWQLLRQDSLKLLLPAFPFAHQHAWISKVIPNQIVRAQMQVFISPYSNYGSKIVQSWGSVAPGIFSFVHSFNAARTRVFCYDADWLVYILQRKVEHSANAREICMRR